jgi:hypothetical protein
MAARVTFPHAGPHERTTRINLVTRSAAAAYVQRVRVALVLVVFLLVGCGGQQRAASGSAKLLVKQSLDFSGGVPIEGEYSYARVESPDGEKVTEERLPGNGKDTIRLDPGSYRLISYQRTCDGNCGNLDPPSERCSSPFTISGDKSLGARIKVTFGSGCTIEFEQ